MSDYNIETSRICHNCGFEWKLPYSKLKEIILSLRHEDNIKNSYASEYAKEVIICENCPSCEVSMCVYADNPDEIQHHIPKKNRRKAFLCSIGTHDFKGNLRHSLYTCRKCNQVVKYKNAKIIYLN